jgi:hypothetical protein
MILQTHATGTAMSPEEKARRGLEYLRDALISMIEQRQSILNSEQKIFELIPERRSIKIQENFLNENEKVPELSFNGKWLLEAGFHCNQNASIFVVQDMLLICPQAALVEESAPN